MLTVTTIVELRDALRKWRQTGERIGLVPTMGNLHAGHLSLVELARQHSTRCVATIFVNPTQFGPNEDFDSYPRTLAEDSEKLAAAGVDLLFAPATAEIYPWKVAQNCADSSEIGSYEATRVVVPQITKFLCGASRPGHFDGVSSVVSILFNLVGPDVAVFGKKDYQQLAVIRRMVSDLHIPVEVIGAETGRAPDGLALSSRNQYLTDNERNCAPALRQALLNMAGVLQQGGRSAEQVNDLIDESQNRLLRAGFQPEYLEVRKAGLGERDNPDYGDLVILAAARLGRARLIDNIEIPAIPKTA